MEIRGNNFNEVFIESIKKINEDGIWTNPRGFKCKEILSPVLILNDPNNCLCTIKDRKLNYAFVIIEKFLFLSGESKPDIILAYNKQMKNYLNDKGDFDGAYGPRVNGQLDFIYKELKNDKDSRRAVVTIHNDIDNNIGTKDSACTLSWQFMIRENKLVMFVNMRSNDVNWGLSIDIPTFAFMQEVMASWLDIELGKYIHHPASLHYYDEFETKLLSYDREAELNYRKNPKWNISYDETPRALEKFWTSEKIIREDLRLVKTNYDVINVYLEQLLKYWKSKNK